MCYENRSKSSKGFKKTTWRMDNGDVANGTKWKETVPTASSKRSKVLCAVDGCNSEVSRSNAWVGIFM